MASHKSAAIPTVLILCAVVLASAGFIGPDNPRVKSIRWILGRERKELMARTVEAAFVLKDPETGFECETPLIKIRRKKRRSKARLERLGDCAYFQGNEDRMMEVTVRGWRDLVLPLKKLEIKYTHGKSACDIGDDDAVIDKDTTFYCA